MSDLSSSQSVCQAFDSIWQSPQRKRVKPYPPSFSSTADETNARQKNRTFCASLFFHSCRRSSKVCQHPIAAMQDGGLLGPRRFCARVHSQKVTYPVTLFSSPSVACTEHEDTCTNKDTATLSQSCQTLRNAFTTKFIKLQTP